MVICNWLSNFIIVKAAEDSFNLETTVMWNGTRRVVS